MPALAVAPAQVFAPPAPSGLGRHDFAFQTGSWRVLHRKLKRRLVGDTDWSVFDGTCEAWEVQDGGGNVEDQWLDDPAGEYRAAGVRRCDPTTGEWSIWWWDARFVDIGAPVRGRFHDGVGTFYADDTLDGRPIRVRFIWSGITATEAHWEQAFSADSGKTWETNWTMRFTR